ncbi:unnamed protein product [Rotaria sp. Silwood1]|nr:unnamed protein product [Rotaria sp. Silwood1]CAF0960632.1 unnamed protein product [Rotaria sp. Silwood1]CAF3401497.1 unnamed protein product [Rotaria sp. Silwood1]CAF4661181.1 unnamed protein product [Rotaria sp. Silwood1]
MRIIIFLSIIFWLSIINTNADEIHNKEIYYPPYWDQAPSSLNDFPLINGSSSQYRLINPWSYIHRLGLYKILINVTTPYMPFCSSSNASNILFALPSQFGWQFSSNRLFTYDEMMISTTSWWGSANYYLAVIPFLVAMDVGIIKREPFRIFREENFCTNSSECFDQIPDAMIQWYRFFYHLKQSSSCIGNKKIDGRIMDKCYLTYMWLAYTSTIYNALPLVESKLQYLPSKVEKTFGLSWAKLINLISMTRKNTNLYETIRNQRRFSPFRLLKDSDRSATSKDLPDSVNKSLKILFSFRYDWLSFIENVWRRLTCNYDARVYAQHTLDTMGVSKLVAFYNLIRAAINAFLYRCDSFY